MNRNQCATLGAEAVDIADRGWYVATSGRRVEIADAIARSVSGTETVAPDDWPRIHREAQQRVAASRIPQPEVEVTDETTLAAARRLTGASGAEVLALNFASAKNPGGGFLGGSRAQEESIARSSSLYASLLEAPRYYAANRASHSTFYTDHAVYSPGVVVFRDDAGALLEEPYRAAIVTAPAANVSALRQHGRTDGAGERIAATMKRRTDNVLALAAARGHDTLVLGAWGCGVFGNDPALIARLFAEALASPLGRCFRRVTFAVYDTAPSRATLSAFRRELRA
jgi:uncharacterized protein (TIGR02452 family)